ncbi:MAG: prolipoprotein diacylglyceryl transferase [Anaerolineaceae bacterium 4572_78]|nr:MAG: prolipoprotein diacylglyceryl transferase [Anaerolineaceae bacterium 4572_78]
MLDPIIYTIRIGSIELPIRWYGLLVVIGALFAAWYATWYFKRKGEDHEIVWDVMVWLLIGGIIGARIWYVIADMIGGHTRYFDDPIQIVMINQGGLNILGGVVVGALVAWFYTRRYKIDFWLLVDAAAPGLLIGQAIGRLGNYINQELYGPPTELSWGIQIDAEHRLFPWNDILEYPFETTFFHPTFAYEMAWNLIFAAILIYFVVAKGDKIRTGIIAGSWLIIAGVGRMWIELFRPDQPSFFGAPFSTSTVISGLFALIGLFIVLVKMGKIQVPFMQEGAYEYAIADKKLTRLEREQLRRQRREERRQQPPSKD